MANGSEGSELNTIVAPEGATVRNASEFKMKLQEAFDGHSRVELDLSRVQELDVSLFQLVCSAHRTAENQNKSFTVNLGEASGAVLAAIQQSGLSRHMGCFLDDRGNCPWAEEA